MSETFKLGQLAPFELPSVKDSTLPGTGNDFNKQLDDIVNSFSKGQKVSGDSILTKESPRKRRANEKVDFGKAFDSSVESLKATGHGAAAAVGTALGFQDFAESEIKASQKNQRKADRLARGLILDLKDVEFDKGLVEGTGDLLSYFVNGAGTIAPSVLETVTAAAAGAAIGSAAPGAGTVAGGVIGGVAKIAGKKKLQSLIKEYVRTKGFREVAGTSARQKVINERKKKIASSAISKFYQTTAVVASGQTLGTGEVFNEALEAGATQEEASQFGLIGGIPFAALDSVLPASIIKDIGGKFVGGRVKNALREAGEGFVKEGATELAQEELLLRTKENFDKDFDIAGEEAGSRRLNAFVLGGFAGGVLGAGSGALQGKVDAKELKTPLTNNDFSSKEVKNSFARVESFTSQSNNMLSKLDSDVDQDKVNSILDKVGGDLEVIKKDLTSKFLSEENTDTASKAEAKEVIEVVDTHLLDTNKAREDISQVTLDRETLDTPDKVTNPEFDNIAAISERVLGISEGLEQDLSKSELETLTQRTQTRLLSLEDQTSSAESSISSIRNIIKEDINEIVRSRDDSTIEPKVVEAQKKKVRVEKDLENLPVSDNTSPKKGRTSTKRARKTEQVIDAGDTGTIDVKSLKNIKSLKDSIKTLSQENIQVRVISKTAKRVQVETENIAGQIHKFFISPTKLTTTKPEPTLEDALVNQVEIQDKIKSKNFTDRTPKKTVAPATPKGTGVSIEQELEDLSTKQKKNKLSNEEILRFNELNNQVGVDDESETVIEDGDISLEQKMAAVSSELKARKAAAVELKLTDNELETISSLNIDIGELQELRSIMDPVVDLEERESIQLRIKQLQSEKRDILGVVTEQNTSQKNVVERTPSVNNNIVITEDVDNVLIETKDTAIPRSPTPELTTKMNSMIDRITSGLTSTNSDIDIKYATSFKEFQNIADRKDINRLRFDSIKAIAIKNPDGRPLIVINGTKESMQRPETVAATLMHELVGHIGMSRVFGNKFTEFKRSLLDGNIALRNDILRLSTRWKVYRESWLKLNNRDESGLNVTNSYTFKDLATNETVRLHDSVALVLAEEYMAELASIKMIDKQFNVKANLREGFVNRVLKKLMHFARSTFGKFTSGINEEDMLGAVAASANFLFQDNNIFKFSDIRQSVLRAELRNRADGINLDAVGRLKVDRNLGLGLEKTFENNKLKQSEKSFIDDLENIDIEQFAFDMEEGRSAAEAMGADKKITDGVTRALSSGYGKLNESSRVSFMNEVGRKVQNNPFLSKFFALGNLPHKELYNATQAVSKGKLGKLERLARKSFTDLKGLSNFQSERVFKFFTTRFTEAEGSIAIQDLQRQGISQDIINTILESKGTIESLGQQYVDLGLLDVSIFEENQGRYLPTRYLEYIFTNPGGGKKTSFLNFLKKKKDLDENTKGMLGQIKDPSFIVAETIGMLGRDVAILQMFESLADNGRKGSTGWVLNSSDFVNFRGKNMSLDTIQNEIDRVERILSEHDTDKTGAFQLTEEQEQFNRAALVEMREEEANAEQRMLDRLSREAKEQGLGEIDPAQYRADNYKQLTKSKRLGALSNLWVRKEIANDLEGVLNSFEVDPDDPISQWFGGHGKLVRANSYWKQLKVPFNLPSWFRNGVGNLTLLDISTTTPINQLTKMFTEEVGGAISKKESKYWKWAVDNGLFGTTYSANELYGFQRDFARKSKLAVKNDKLTVGSKVKGMFSFMNEQFLAAADTAGLGFGYLEGSFKAVAMRDFIQQWQQQNDVKNIETLPNDQMQAVILEAVAHANNALFDYSQVPSLVSFARRYPLGAPFITFMYKSFPVVIEALAKRPQKFIKYAAFPMMMNMLAQGMNDWDDDEIERLNASLPQWTRDKSSVFLFPFKDSDGRPQFAEYGYALPWSPFIDAGLKVNNHFEAENISQAVSSTLTLGADISDDMGFLGGPMSTLITAFKSNKDSFTGRTIVNPGDSAQKKLADMVTWGWNMTAPSFISSHGFLGKLYDDLDIDLPGLPAPRPLDSFGKDRNTTGQVFGNLTGFQTRGFDPEDSVQNSLKVFAIRLREITIARNKFLRDPNIRKNNEQRAAGLRDFNTRQKLLKQERSEFLNKVRG